MVRRPGQDVVAKGLKRSGFTEEMGVSKRRRAVSVEDATSSSKKRAKTSERLTIADVASVEKDDDVIDDEEEEEEEDEDDDGGEGELDGMPSLDAMLGHASQVTGLLAGTMAQTMAGLGEMMRGMEQALQNTATGLHQSTASSAKRAKAIKERANGSTAT